MVGENLNNFIFTLLELTLPSVQRILLSVILPLHRSKVLTKQDTMRTSRTDTWYWGWSSWWRFSWSSEEQK